MSTIKNVLLVTIATTAALAIACKWVERKNVAAVEHLIDEMEDYVISNPTHWEKHNDMTLCKPIIDQLQQMVQNYNKNCHPSYRVVGIAKYTKNRVGFHIRWKKEQHMVDL